MADADRSGASQRASWCADYPCSGCDNCQPDRPCVVRLRSAWRADCTECGWFGALRGTELAAKFDARDHDLTHANAPLSAGGDS